MGESETQGEGRQFLKLFCQRLRGESGPEAGLVVFFGSVTSVSCKAGGGGWGHKFFLLKGR